MITKQDAGRRRRLTPCRPSRVWIAGIILTLGGIVAPAGAQDSNASNYGPAAENFEFTLSGSGGSDNELNRGSFGLATSLGYFITEGWQAGARHNMTFFDSDESDSSVAATSRIFIDYHFDFDRIRPYVGFNLGVRYGDDGVDEVGTAAPEWGIKAFALEDTFIQLSMEYQFFFDDVDDADQRSDNGQFVYGLGLGFVF